MELLAVLCSFSAGLWMAFPAGMTKAQAAPSADQNPSSDSAAIGNKVYCSLGKHVLLLLFTFGIWPLIWVYRMTEYLNCVKNEPSRGPAAQLLLYLFIPFYSIYWFYKSAQRIDALAKTRRVSSDLSVICPVLAIFISFIPMILMQEKVNTIIKSKPADILPGTQL